MANKTYTLGPTTGWTKEELKMLKGMEKQLETTRSSLFRSLVRNAFAKSEGQNYRLVSVIGLEVEGADLIPVVAPASFVGGKDAAKQ